MILTGPPNTSRTYVSGSSPKKDRRLSYKPRRFGNTCRHSEGGNTFIQLAEPVHHGHETYEMSRSMGASGGNADPLVKVSQAREEDGTSKGIDMRYETEVGWIQV